MRSRLALSIFVGVVSLGALSAAHAQKRATGGKSAAPRLEVTKYKLKNGLEVILHRDDRLPLVAVNLWAHVGGINERPGRSGFAHLFEHMMFQGSASIKDDEHFQILESIGGRSVNASTDFDRTNYFEMAPSNQLETLLWLESDRFGFLPNAIDKRKLDNQIEVVRNERRQSLENTPYGEADERIYKLLFPAPHPYNGVVIGTHEDLAAATVDDVVSFFKEYYDPSNLSLVVAGDFDEKQARQLVDKYFGSLPSRGTGRARRAPEAALQAPPKEEIRENMTDDVKLPRVSVAWVTVPIYKAGEPELDTAARLLTEGKASRLHRKLIVEQKVAQRVTCSLYPLEAGSVFQCDLYAKPGGDVAQLEKALDAELADLAGKGPRKDELARIKAKRRADFMRMLENIVRRADVINEYNHHLGDPGYLQKDLARYQAVTAGGVSKNVKKWLDPERRVVIVVQPEAR